MSLKLSGKIFKVTPNGLLFHCPGCKDNHVIYVNREERPCWTYNDNPEKPTFSPSILVGGLQTERIDDKWTGDYIRDGAGNPKPLCCHSFVTDGNIQFLDDCTHELKGQTVPLPDIPC